MKLSKNTKINDLLKQYEFLQDFLVSYNPTFSMLKNKVARATVGRVATLGRVGAMANVPVNDLIRAIASEIAKQTGDDVLPDAMKTTLTEDEKKQALKDVLRKLHEGASVDSLKQQFGDLLDSIGPGEISEIEQSIIDEGTPAEEIQKLCDLHAELFKGGVEGEAVNVPPGHPLDHYMKENECLQQRLNTLEATAKAISLAGLDNQRPGLKRALEDLEAIDTHFARKENQLFPALEKKGITGPPQVMWGVDDEIREKLKGLRRAVESDGADAFMTDCNAFVRQARDMIFKEEKILFPMTLEAIPANEWVAIGHGDAEVGFSWIEPDATWLEANPLDSKTWGGDELLDLRVGQMTFEQIDLLFRHLPVDISFVDEHDRVRFYNDCKHRFFPRSPSVIGREVQKCHPSTSVEMVNQILTAFRNGEKDHADFWINMKDVFLYIRYFAVRDDDGVYKGCLEVAQDGTEIRSLTGEKRLLSWE